MSASASPTPPRAARFSTGQSSYVTRLGVQFAYRVLNETNKYWETLCTTGTVNGLVPYIAMDMNVPGSNAPLPGSVQLGGALGVLGRIRGFLGTDPAHWTTTPLG